MGMIDITGRAPQSDIDYYDRPDRWGVACGGTMMFFMASEDDPIDPRLPEGAKVVRPLYGLDFTVCKVAYWLGVHPDKVCRLFFRMVFVRET